MARLIPCLISLFLGMSSAISDEKKHLQTLPDVSGGQLGGDFNLHSSHGAFSLKQLRGKVVLLYFGYTKCPDVCPTSLAVLAQALNELTDDELKSVQGVFVSVDPRRDTPQLLEDYVSHFHPNLIGVTGSQWEIAEAAKGYSVQYEEVAGDSSSFGYTVDHSSQTYLLSQTGELRYLFPHQTPSFVILEAIRYLLDGD